MKAHQGGGGLSFALPLGSRRSQKHTGAGEKETLNKNVVGTVKMANMKKNNKKDKTKKMKHTDIHTVFEGLKA